MKVSGADDDAHASLPDDSVDAELTREYSSHRNHRSRVSHTIRHSLDESTTWPRIALDADLPRVAVGTWPRNHCASRIATTGRLTPSWRRRSAGCASWSRTTGPRSP